MNSPFFRFWILGLSIVHFVVFDSQLFAQSGRLVNFPQAVTVHEGQKFVISVYSDPGGEQVSAIDLHLAYNPELITLLEVEKIPCPLNLNPIEPRIDNESGRLMFAAFRLQEPWPSERFELVRLHFMALAPVENTSVSHASQTKQKSLMAYAGKNIMSHAVDTEVTILKNNPTSPQRSNLNSTEFALNQNGTGLTADIVFQPAEHGQAVLEMRNDELSVNQTLYNYEVEAGTHYLFAIDYSVLKTGLYEVILSHAGSRYVQQLNVRDR